ncbi:MAG TPA: tail fiber protein [Bryobacteraceae bacterium]|nr:tail fiber protein [Bryobacteraceae bacterium]
MSEPFLGEIRMFGGNFAPKGWALCNGQIMSIAQNTALFSLLGTTFGGNGQTTFGLPDLRGRVPVHAGQGPGLSPYTPGESTGNENQTLNVNQMPIHSHVVNASNAAAGRGGNSPTGNIPAATTVTGGNNVTAEIYGGTANTTMSPTMIGNTGGGQPFSVIQPVLCVNFIIATQGIYPSRN